jgi:hypothetical protein
LQFIGQYVRTNKSLLQWEKVDFAKQKTDEVFQNESNSSSTAAAVPLLPQEKARKYSHFVKL